MDQLIGFLKAHKYQIIKYAKKAFQFYKKKQQEAAGGGYAQNQQGGYPDQQQGGAWQQPNQGPAYQQGGAWQPPSKPQKPHAAPVGGSAVGPHHPQNQDQINASNEQYQSLRNQAHHEGDLMGRCFDQAHEAYNQGDGGRAKQLSNEGHAHQRKMEELNKQAADWIFRENNNDSPEGTIDLHGLYVEEALERTEVAIQEAQRQNRDTLRIIVGKGIHSKNHVAKIAPAVQQLMQKYGLAAHLDPHNTGVLVVSLTGGGRDRGMSNVVDMSWAKGLGGDKDADCSIM